MSDAVGSKEEFVRVSSLNPYCVRPTTPYIQIVVACYYPIVNSRVHHCERAILKLVSAGSLCPEEISCKEVVSVCTLYNLLTHAPVKLPRLNYSPLRTRYLKARVVREVSSERDLVREDN